MKGVCTRQDCKFCSSLFDAIMFGNGLLIVWVKCTHNDIDMWKYVCMGLGVWLSVWDKTNL